MVVSMDVQMLSDEKQNLCTGKFLHANMHICNLDREIKVGGHDEDKAIVGIVMYFFHHCHPKRHSMYGSMP